MHRRAILYAVLALAVPLPALALTGQGGGSNTTGDVDLTVSAALDSCGTAADSIVCKIDATWNAIPGATRYTASVTRADGSVVDFGEVGAGSGSFWVPYVGNGTYTVSISAYGTPPDEGGHRTVIARGHDAAGAEATESSSFGTEDAPGPATAPSDSGDATDTENPGPPAEEPDEPTCEEPADPPVPTEPPATDPGAPGDESGGKEAPLSEEAASALPDTAEAPDSVECPPPPDDPAVAPVG